MTTWALSICLLRARSRRAPLRHEPRGYRETTVHDPSDRLSSGVATLVASFALALVALGGCSKPAGIEPSQYSDLPKFGGAVVYAECLKVQERARESKPAYYSCMSKCVVESSDHAAFTGCARKCAVLDK